MPFSPPRRLGPPYRVGRGQGAPAPPRPRGCGAGPGARTPGPAAVGGPELFQFRTPGSPVPPSQTFGSPIAPSLRLLCPLFPPSRTSGSPIAPSQTPGSHIPASWQPGLPPPDAWVPHSLLPDSLVPPVPPGCHPFFHPWTPGSPITPLPATWPPTTSCLGSPFPLPRPPGPLTWWRGVAGPHSERPTARPAVARKRRMAK